MYTTEVVMKEIQSNLMRVVLKFLTESVRQPRESAHSHPHRKIAAFHKRRADMFGIRIAAKYASATANAGCRAVARFRAVARCAVNLDEHRVVNVRSEGVLDSVGINAMAVRGQLNPVADPARNVLHEFV